MSCLQPWQHDSVFPISLPLVHFIKQDDDQDKSAGSAAEEDKEEGSHSSGDSR